MKQEYSALLLFVFTRRIIAIHQKSAAYIESDYASPAKRAQKSVVQKHSYAIKHPIVLSSKCGIFWERFVANWIAIYVSECFHD